VTWIDDHYRTIPERSARGIIGISAGGYGATLIAIHHPETYSVIESCSARTATRSSASTSERKIRTPTSSETIRPSTQSSPPRALAEAVKRLDPPERSGA
jgi:enterochelin esterase-like enzyme